MFSYILNKLYINVFIFFGTRLGHLFGALPRSNAPLGAQKVAPLGVPRGNKNVPQPAKTCPARGTKPGHVRFPVSLSKTEEEWGVSKLEKMRKRNMFFSKKNRFCDGGVKVDWNLFIFRPLYFMLN